MLTKTDAVVLHAFKYGESRLIVDMFTREEGRLSFIVSLPKSAKSRFRKQLLQPLSLLNIEADLRPRAQLQKLRDLSLVVPLPDLQTEPRKLSVSLFLAEFLYHALKGEQRNELLYDYISSGIQWLDGATEGFANFHLVFLLRLSRFLGFYPNLDDYVEGDCFDLRESRFCAVSPLHRDFLGPGDAWRLHQLVRMDFPTMYLFRMSHEDRNRFLEVALAYYRLHLPDFPELRSIGVLQELYR